VRIFAIAMFLLSWPLAFGRAQTPLSMVVPYGQYFEAVRFGRILIGAYVGTLRFTMQAGTSSYAASATLRDGRVHCTATARSEAGTFNVTGEGLIEISLGLDPDADADPPIPAGVKMYTIRVACPHPRSPPPHEARWSEEWSTYKQVGGAYDHTVDARGMLLRSLPTHLRGRWEDTTGEETRTMGWYLCLRDASCWQDALANPPEAPPTPP